MRPEQTTERRSFHLKRCIGRGGFGEVYLATMTSAGGVRSEVAVKLLLKDLDPRGQAVQRLRDEGHVLGALNHPSILRVHDIVALDGRVALVAEYVDGADLNLLVRGEQRMTERALLEVIVHVAEAIHAAWTSVGPDGNELRLVHRDIKPQNIRVGRHGDVKVLDFGIARATNDNVSREAHTQANIVVGSLGYIAPERMFSTGPVDPAGDIFALGGVLYEGITQQTLFHGLPEKRIFRLTLDGDQYAPFLTERLSEVANVEIRELLQAMLAFAPGDRPTPRDLASRAEHLGEKIGGPPLKRWCRDHAWGDARSFSGALDGQTLLDATLARTGATERPEALPPEETGESKAATPNWMLAGAGVATVFLAGGAGAGVVLAIALAVAFFVTTGPTGAPVGPTGAPVGVEAAVQPITPPVVVAAPVEAPPVVAVVEPPPVAPVTPPVVAPVETPPVVAPVVAPPAPPAVVAAVPAKVEPKKVEVKKAAATGTVRANGSTAVKLLANGAAFSPGELPPGRYDVQVDFGSGPVPGGSVEVKEGSQITLNCSAIRQRCTVEGG